MLSTKASHLTTIMDRTLECARGLMSVPYWKNSSMFWNANYYITIWHKISSCKGQDNDINMGKTWHALGKVWKMERFGTYWQGFQIWRFNLWTSLSCAIDIFFLLRKITFKSRPLQTTLWSENINLTAQRNCTRVQITTKPVLCHFHRQG